MLSWYNKHFFSENFAYVLNFAYFFFQWFCCWLCIRKCLLGIFWLCNVNGNDSFCEISDFFFAKMCAKERSKNNLTWLFIWSYFSLRKSRSLQEMFIVVNSRIATFLIKVSIKSGGLVKDRINVISFHYPIPE